jgi:outer membrane protein assembly factor BamA
MIGRFFVFVLLCVLLGSQSSTEPRINRIFVTTPYNASIVYEYANASIREGEPINQGTLDCVASQLRATGLFSEIKITRKPVTARLVDIEIVPVWSASRNDFVIGEITIEGFTSVDQNELLTRLGKKGVKAGTPLLKFPLPSIRKMVIDSIREIYHADPGTMNGVEEQSSDLSFKLDQISPHSVRLVLTDINNPACAAK